MASKDLYNNIEIERMISPGDYDTSGQPDAQVVDTLGYESVTVVFFAGAITTSQTMTLEHSVDNSAWDNIEAGDIIADPDNTAADIRTAFLTTGTTDHTINVVGYKGPRRYIRVNPTTANDGAFFCVFAILGHGQNRPVDRS